MATYNHVLIASKAPQQTPTRKEGGGLKGSFVRIMGLLLPFLDVSAAE